MEVIQVEEILQEMDMDLETIQRTHTLVTRKVMYLLQPQQLLVVFGLVLEREDYLDIYFLDQVIFF